MEAKEFITKLFEELGVSHEGGVPIVVRYSDFIYSAMKSNITPKETADQLKTKMAAASVARKGITIH